MRRHTHFVKANLDPGTRRIVVLRLQKTFSLIPGEALDLFFSGTRKLSVRILPDAGFPIGMRTTAGGPSGARDCEIIVREEHCRFPEDLFIASVLRELGHVVAGLPTEDEWPAARGDRARFKEQLECRADTMVWKWGLRHYGMRYLCATYPPHWVDRIVADIERMLSEEEAN
ncbi:MAG: hypothetical protein V1792_20790 [Pseudomonadota bacterium]